MRTYLLITGGWLVVAAAAAFVYARLAAFGARCDAHLGEPQPLPRRLSWTFPLQVAAPLTVACAAAIFLGDFGWDPQAGRTPAPVLEAAPPAVRLAQVPERETREPARRDRRRAASRRASRRAGSLPPAELVSAAAPAPAPAPVSRPAPPTRQVQVLRPRRPRRPQQPRPAATPSPSPSPVPSPVAVAAAEPTAEPTRAPEPATAPAPAPAPASPSGKKKRRGHGPPPHAPAHGHRAKRGGD